MPGPTELDESGAALWRALGDSWTDEARHDRFVQHVVASGRWAAAAARYRAYAAQHPQDALAGKMMARIVSLVTQQALRPTPPPERALARSPFFIAVIAVAAVLGMVLGLLWRGAR